MILIAIFYVQWVIGIVDLRVSDAVAAKHNIHINLKVQNRIIADGRVSQ